MGRFPDVSVKAITAPADRKLGATLKPAPGLPAEIFRTTRMPTLLLYAGCGTAKNSSEAGHRFETLECPVTTPVVVVKPLYQLPPRIPL